VKRYGKERAENFFVAGIVVSSSRVGYDYKAIARIGKF
jgi:hypothetical protein